jgi:hypothetical protein
MAKIVILDLLLFLIRHVDQNIEPITVVVTINDRQPLLFVELQDFPNRYAELIQETVVFFTAGTAERRSGCFLWCIV